MNHLLPIYLAALRKQWGLTQDELAFLLSLEPTGLSRVEALERQPVLRIVLGSEIVFGESARDIFPQLFSEVEQRVLEQAFILLERWDLSRDGRPDHGRTQLRALIARLESSDDRL